MDCGWSGRDGSSVRRRQLWECTTGRYRRGCAAGIEREVWRGAVPQDGRQGQTAVGLSFRSGAGVDRGGVERAIQDSGRDQGLDRVRVWSELQVGQRLPVCLRGWDAARRFRGPVSCAGTRGKRGLQSLVSLGYGGFAAGRRQTSWSEGASAVARMVRSGRTCSG